MRFELRVYRIAPGVMEEFVREWDEHVRPQRLAHGFSIVGPWTADDRETFVWIVGHEGDFEAADQAYYRSPERRAIEPDPARHIVEARTWLMRSPSPARPRAR